MDQRGMSKIEALVVAGIIGLLGMMAIVAITNARSRTRDAVRMSDVRQIQTSLELHFIDRNTYPESEVLVALGTTTHACLDENGWNTVCSDSPYMSVVPFTPTAGLKNLSSCEEYNNAYCYLSDGEEYRIQFELEHANPLIELQKGLNCATQNGLEAGACEPLP